MKSHRLSPTQFPNMRVISKPTDLRLRSINQQIPRHRAMVAQFKMPVGFPRFRCSAQRKCKCNSGVYQKRRSSARPSSQKARASWCAPLRTISGRLTAYTTPEQAPRRIDKPNRAFGASASVHPFFCTQKLRYLLCEAFGISVISGFD